MSTAGWVIFGSIAGLFATIGLIYGVLWFVDWAGAREDGSEKKNE